MKKVFSFLTSLIFILLLLIAVYFSAALLLSYLPANSSGKDCIEKQEAYVSSNGVHLFLILPIDHLENDFLDKLDYPKETRYISFGWGEKTFYLNTPGWDDLTFPVAAKALLIPSESAMHVSYYPSLRRSWYEVPLCEEQSRVIVSFVQNSFDDSGNEFVPLQPKGYGPNNYFYEARGKYTCIKTSNEWVNQALKKAGVKTSIWSPMTFGVLQHIEDE